LGGCTKIVQDVPPFMIADGNPAEVRGINQVGLERNDFSADAVRNLREAYRIIYRSNLNTKQAVQSIREQLQGTEISIVVEFIEASERGIVR
ncbi:MAG: acyl-[acyl-carrier-protein]--UDP-N-acetylglucosamine O-acyltransferase, partial [Chthoniobacterales bacterium]